MNKFLLIIFLLVVKLNYGQSITNQVSIGGTQQDKFSHYKNLSVNQHWLLGSSNSLSNTGNLTATNHGGNDFWIVKLSSTLQPVFNLGFGGTSEDLLTDALIDGDRMILAGYSNSVISGNKTVGTNGLNDAWIIACDTTGGILWQKNYGGTGDEGPTNICIYSDSSFILLCTSNSPISGNKTAPVIGGDDLWMLEVAYSDGHIIRQRSVGTSDNEGNGFPLKLANGNILISTYTYGTVSGDKLDPGYGDADIWLVEFNSSWNYVRDKALGGTYMENLYSSIQSCSDGYYLAALTYSQPSGTIVNPTFNSNGYPDVWITKLNSNLNVIWEKTFGGTDYENFPKISQLSHGKILLSTSSNSLNGSGNRNATKYGFEDIWTILIDTNGQEVNQHSYGGSQFDEGYFDVYEGDTLILNSYSNSPVSGIKTVGTNGQYDTWIGLLDWSNYLSIDAISEKMFSLYPNPNKGTFSISSNENFKIQRITDITGKEIQFELNQNSIKLEGISKGTYLIHTDINEILKFVVE